MFFELTALVKRKWADWMIILLLFSMILPIGNMLTDESLHACGFIRDVAAYMKYYNLERLHTANENLSPINYENSLKKVSGWS